MATASVPPIRLIVSASEQYQRLDRFVRRHLPGVSRNSIRRLLQSGQILVNGVRSAKGTELQVGDRVVVAVASLTEQPLPQPELSLELIEVSDDLLVVNKQVGIPCHPLLPGETDTVANAIVARFPECANVGPHLREAGLVHRLDWSTSGLLIAARTQRTYGKLRGLFSGGQVTKSYLALVIGHLGQPCTIDAPLESMPGDARRVRPTTSGHGQSAVTNVTPLWQTASPVAALTFVEACSNAGRRHQIRVHLASIGHPLVGDDLYGPEDPSHERGAFLHAHRLDLGPQGPTFEAPMPNARQQVLRQLGAPPKIAEYSG